MSLHLINAGPSDTWQICVMTRDETYFANTSGAIRGFDLIAPGTFHDTGALLADMGKACDGQPEAVLLVPVLPGSGEEYESTTSLASRWTGMEASALRSGWMVTGDSEKIRDNGWVTFRHLETGDKIFMGILSLMDQDRTPLFDLAASAETIVNALLTYASVTGVIWRMTAGVSGCASIRADRKERAEIQLTLPEIEEDPDQGQPHWRWDKAPADMRGVGHMIWSRPLVPAERQGKVVTYDVRAQFLAALAGGRFGWGEPAQRTRVPFDPERAGFWLIAASGLMSLDGPPIIKTADDTLLSPSGRGLVPVTTPVMVYMRDRGIEPMVYDSWTSATSSQFLKPWAQKIRNALYAQSETIRAIEPALKRSYSETNGLFNVKGGSIFRPDWHWTTVDLSTMNLRRKLDKVKRSIGIWPCEIYHDAVSYPVEDAQMFRDLNESLGVAYPPGERIEIGKFKYKGSISVQDWQAKQDNKRKARSQ